MTQEEINKGNQLIDSYMESKGEYISHKDAWGAEVWGSYKPNNYYSSLDLLAPVIQKIEKEDNAVFELRQNGCTILKWNLRIKGGNGSFDLPNWSNNVFRVIVKYLETK